MRIFHFISQQIVQLWKNAASKPPNFSEEFQKELIPSLQKIMALALTNRPSTDTLSLFRVRLLLCQLVLEAPFLWSPKKGDLQLDASSKEVAKTLNFPSKIVRWLAEIPREQVDLDNAMTTFMRALYLVWDNFT